MDLDFGVEQFYKKEGIGCDAFLVNARTAIPTFTAGAVLG